MIVIVIISNIIIILSSYLIFKKKMKFFEQKLTTVFADNNLKIESYKNELSNVFDSWRMEILSNHIFLNENAIIKDVDSKRTNLHNVLGGSPKLVFRITDDISSCYDCKDKILNELNELSKTIGNENILILGRYDKLKDLILLKEKKQIGFNVYNCNDQLGLYADNYKNIDYVFVVDEDFESKMTFIINNVSKEKVEVYFNKIDSYFKFAANRLR